MIKDIYKLIVPQTNRFAAAGIGFGWLSLFFIALAGKRLHDAASGSRQNQQVIEINSRFFFWPTLVLGILFFLYAVAGVTARIRLTIVSIIMGVLFYYIFLGQVCDIEHQMAHILYGTCMGPNPNGIVFSGYPFSIISSGFILYVIIQTFINSYRSSSNQSLKGSA